MQSIVVRKGIHLQRANLLCVHPTQRPWRALASTGYEKGK